MCGRFAFYSPTEAVAELFSVHGAPDFPPRYNIAPTASVAAIRSGESDEREWASLRWGLIPFWAKDKSIGQRMINARAETVAEKPAYRAAFKHRRCVVPADGFYEWRRDGSAKTPYFISLANGEPFAFGGLWESWTDKESGEIVESVTLITGAANAFMEQLHHRMPLILEPAGVERWLRGDASQLDPFEAPPLRAWAVDRRVNNARNEGEDLIEAVGDSLTDAS